MRLEAADFLSIADLTAEELTELLDLAARMKAGEQSSTFAGKVVALLFEHPSLRTRVTFEMAIHQLQALPIHLAQENMKLGERESIPDMARNLERWVHAIVARVRAHSALMVLAEWAHIPVINALSDLEHPCQVLADLLTLKERLGRLAGVRLAFSGDGNNVCHSLLLAAGKLGMHLSVACPPGFEPRAEVVKLALVEAERTGGTIRIGQQPEEMVEDAEAVYTDVWASMGQEAEAEHRRRLFAPYQLNTRLVQRACPGALIMHCLPAHRGEEITDEAIESKQSVVFDQAENRLYAQKALLSMLL